MSDPPRRPDWLPYAVPMGVFLVLTSLEGYLPRSGDGPDPTWYASAYALKVALVTIAAWACRSSWRDLAPRPGLGGWALAIGLGFGLAALWVGLDGHYPPIGSLGKRSGFDPHTLPGPGRPAFLAVRLFGLVALVPLVEELFWRSFLMRWVIDQDFAKVPIGRVTPLAAGVTSALFVSAHPAEWLPALVCGLSWAWLLHRTRSVSACVASHMAANLGLGIYVLWARAWHFW